MLSQCREFNVSLTVATQYLDDIDPALTSAILNNTMTKAVFSPGASEDLPTYNQVMNGVPRQKLTKIGEYRPVIQRPAEQKMPEAVTVDTYPPWNYSQETIEDRKEELLKQYDPLKDQPSNTEVSTGATAAAGGETHEKLLAEAKQFLEFEYGAQVNKNQQDGNSRPDGYVIIDGETLHLEAEHSTLSKPEKVLKNLERAQNQDRECIFIIQEQQVNRLQTILENTSEDQYRVLASTDVGVIEQ
jgi:hypothetical protein